MTLLRLPGTGCDMPVIVSVTGSGFLVTPQPSAFVCGGPFQRAARHGVPGHRVLAKHPATVVMARAIQYPGPRSGPEHTSDRGGVWRTQCYEDSQGKLTARENVSRDFTLY